MKIRWRKHEFIIVSILIFLGMIGDALNVKHFTAPFLVNMGLKGFAQYHLSFSYSRNILLPQLSVLLVFYLVFLWLPHFFKVGQKKNSYLPGSYSARRFTKLFIGYRRKCGQLLRASIVL